MRFRTQEKEGTSKPREQGLKGECHEIFCYRFFSQIIFPKDPDNNIRVILNVLENSQKYSQVQVHHRYQRHRWQIMGTILDCLHLKANLKKKFIYVLSLLPEGVQTRYLKLL